MRILITGASGCGTTTLGRALAGELDSAHLDADDFYWVATAPSFQEKRTPQERLSILLSALATERNAVVSGSIVGWGHEVEDGFDLIVFLYVSTSIRLERLRERETRRYGRADPAFLRWAELYDVGPPEGRSLAKHNAWLEARRCPVLRLEGDLSVEERVRAVLQAVGQAGLGPSPRK